jgi:hypothetical protein
MAFDKWQVERSDIPSERSEAGALRWLGTIGNWQLATNNWSEATSRSLENLRGLAAGQGEIRFS